MANRGPTLDENVFTIEDLKREGNGRLPKMYEDYFNGGAMDMITLRENEAAYNHYRILPRILINVQNIDTGTEIFGCKVSFPLGFSPTAMHKLAHPDGEIATSRAAAKMSICMGLSSYSTTSLEDVAAQGSGNPFVMQMCVLNDRGITKQFLRRAEKAGYKAIFLSVDCPVLGRRLNEFRNSFQLPDDMTWPNINTNGTTTFDINDEALGYDQTLDWETTIPWLREHTKLQLWLKGVNSPDDVELAIQHGLDGVIISNHGGRQLDGAPATLHCLRACAPVAQGRIQIAVDGGIRRGSDIFKALALGAQHCFVGRIPIWGLAYKGQEGVELGVQLLLHEFRTTMALAGCRSIEEISRRHLTTLGVDGRLCKL